MKKKAQLQSMIDKIDWLMIEPSRISWGLGSEEVAVSFYSAHPVEKPDVINKVKIRIGRNILSKLKWEVSDKISVFQDPDHLLTFKLAKTISGSGYTLTKEGTKSFVYVLNFTWGHKIPLERMKNTKVNYHIHKNSLIIFKIGAEEEIDE
jgi:hypothetical protein